MNLIGRRIYNENRRMGATIVSIDDRPVPYVHFDNDDHDNRTAFSQMPLNALLSAKYAIRLIDADDTSIK